MLDGTTWGPDEVGSLCTGVVAFGASELVADRLDVTTGVEADCSMDCVEVISFSVIVVSTLITIVPVSVALIVVDSSETGSETDTDPVWTPGVTSGTDSVDWVAMVCERHGVSVEVANGWYSVPVTIVWELYEGSEAVSDGQGWVSEAPVGWL